jgi:hypothetical protein
VGEGGDCFLRFGQRALWFLEELIDHRGECRWISLWFRMFFVFGEELA